MSYYTVRQRSVRRTPFGRDAFLCLRLRLVCQSSLSTAYPDCLWWLGRWCWAGCVRSCEIPGPVRTLLLTSVGASHVVDLLVVVQVTGLDR